MFTTDDLKELENRGISQGNAQEQLDRLTRGSTPVKISRAAHIDDGLIRLDEAQRHTLKKHWNEYKGQWTFEKFVPASGAATRMFKDLHQFATSQEITPSVEYFFSRLEEFPFFSSLKDQLDARKLLPVDTPTKKRELVNFLLSHGGLNWSRIPKGLLPFHQDDGLSITPLGEQLREGCSYASDSQGNVNIHFTIAGDQKDNFKSMVKREADRITDHRFTVSYSNQEPHTDTLALDEQGEPFRHQDGSLLFRPGGHGSLLGNLNDRESQLLFIKNIDNVQKRELQRDTRDFFQILAGLLLQARDVLKGILEGLPDGPVDLKDDQLQTIKKFTGYDLASTDDTSSLTKEMLTHLFNRPMRACGMVKNEGEPGGGPFWVKESRQSSSLQILESAQLDLEDPWNRDIFQSSTHFNPVFMVCCKVDLQGNRLNLLDFVDSNSYFIAEKSMEGRQLKALEHPGLWNGSMARWNTMFVEIPSQCFTPVKTINDLLRKEHR